MTTSTPRSYATSKSKVQQATSSRRDLVTYLKQDKEEMKFSIEDTASSLLLLNYIQSKFLIYTDSLRLRGGKGVNFNVPASYEHTSANQLTIIINIPPIWEGSTGESAGESRGFNLFSQGQNIYNALGTGENYLKQGIDKWTGLGDTPLNADNIMKASKGALSTTFGDVKLRNAPIGNIQPDEGSEYCSPGCTGKRARKFETSTRSLNVEPMNAEDPDELHYATLDSNESNAGPRGKQLPEFVFNYPNYQRVKSVLQLKGDVEKLSDQVGGIEGGKKLSKNEWRTVLDQNQQTIKSTIGNVARICNDAMSTYKYHSSPTGQINDLISLSDSITRPGGLNLFPIGLRSAPISNVQTPCECRKTGARGFKLSGLFDKADKYKHQFDNVYGTAKNVAKQGHQLYDQLDSMKHFKMTKNRLLSPWDMGKAMVNDKIQMDKMDRAIAINEKQLDMARNKANDQREMDKMDRALAMNEKALVMARAKRNVATLMEQAEGTIAMTKKQLDMATNKANDQIQMDKIDRALVMNEKNLAMARAEADDRIQMEEIDRALAMDKIASARGYNISSALEKAGDVKLRSTPIGDLTPIGVNDNCSPDCAAKQARKFVTSTPKSARSLDVKPPMNVEDPDKLHSAILDSNQSNVGTRGMKLSEEEKVTALDQFEQALKYSAPQAIASKLYDKTDIRNKEREFAEALKCARNQLDMEETMANDKSQMIKLDRALAMARGKAKVRTQIDEMNRAIAMLKKQWDMAEDRANDKSQMDEIDRALVMKIKQLEIDKRDRALLSKIAGLAGARGYNISSALEKAGKYKHQFDNAYNTTKNITMQGHESYDEPSNFGGVELRTTPIRSQPQAEGYCSPCGKQNASPVYSITEKLDHIEARDSQIIDQVKKQQQARRIEVTQMLGNSM